VGGEGMNYESPTVKMKEKITIGLSGLTTNNIIFIVFIVVDINCICASSKCKTLGLRFYVAQTPRYRLIQYKFASLRIQDGRYNKFVESGVSHKWKP